MAAVAAHRSRQSLRSVKSGSSSIDKPNTTKLASKYVSLPKRLLFPHLPPEADLPPLLCSPAAEPSLNAELYEFIALALRAYVNPWWTKITRYDKEFLPAISRILATVIRTLETRLLATDLSPLVFRDLPTLLSQHYADFRNAKSKLHTSYASGGAAPLSQLFHQLQPHMAVSPDGRINDVYIRQAIDHLLKVTLPPEDYDPEVERYVVREVMLSVLLRSVIPRVTQPWFLHKLMLDHLAPVTNISKLSELSSSAPNRSTPNLEGAATPRTGFSLQSLAIAFLSAIQSISGVCLVLLHAYKQARDTIKKVNQNPVIFPQPQHSSLGSDSPESKQDMEPPPVVTSPVPVHLAVPGNLINENPITQIPQTPPTPTSISSLKPVPRSTSNSTVKTASTSSLPPTSPMPTPVPPSPAPPSYTHPPLTLLLTLLSPPPTGPSTAALSTSARTALAFAHTLSLPLTFLEPFFSRLLPYLLYKHVLSVARLTDVVRSARHALFPEGWPGAPPPDPTPEEQVAMRAELGRRLLASVPVPVAFLLGPTPDARMHAIDGMLDPLSSQACNTHLVLFIIDLILLTVFPELGASESSALMASSHGSLGKGAVPMS